MTALATEFSGDDKMLTDKLLCNKVYGEILRSELYCLMRSKLQRGSINTCGSTVVKNCNELPRQTATMKEVSLLEEGFN
jgi:hypothetical protein